MLIRKVRLHNIRSYADEVIEFPEGSLLLSGDIGSGKSTILLAIEFALFGADSDSLSGNALLRKDADEGEVELTFELQEETITIKRGIKRGKTAANQTSGWIIRNGKRKDAMPVELKSDIITLLGYPEALVTKRKNLVYSYTVYCPQEEMKLILSDDKESRLDTLRKIFGIDKYKQVRENCSIFIRELKVRQREMEARIVPLDELKRQQEEKKSAHAALSQDCIKTEQLLQNARAVFEKTKEEKKKAEDDVRLLHEKTRRSEVAAAQKAAKHDVLTVNEAKIAELRITIEKHSPLGSAKELEAQLPEREQRFHEQAARRSAIQQDIRYTEQRITELRKETAADPAADLSTKKMQIAEIAQALMEKEHILRRKEELDSETMRHRAAMKEYEVRKSHAEETRHKILTIATCPVCLQTVSKEHKERVCTAQDDQIEFTEKKLLECRELIRTKEKHSEELRKALDALAVTERKAAALEAELKHLESRQKDTDQKRMMLADLEKKHTALQDEFHIYASFDHEKEAENIHHLRQNLERARECARAEKMAAELADANVLLAREILDLDTALARLRSEVDALKQSEERYAQVQEGLERAAAEERTLSIQHARMATEKNELEKSIQRLGRDIDDMEKTRKSIGSLMQMRHWLEEHFIKLMLNIEKHVMMKIYHEFNDFFRSWFSVLVADENMSARVDDSFNPIVDQNGYEIESAYLSGGERTSVALSYRLALNKVVNDIIHTIKTKELLILDEPTDGFSSEQLDRVRDVLRQLSVKQVILVSHENKIESFVDSVARVVKENGVSRVMRG